MTLPQLTIAEWYAEAERRFGKTVDNWRFVCPVCAYEQSVGQCKAAGLAQNSVAFSCVGRAYQGPVRKAFGGTGAGPCDYAGGGLFKLNPQPVLMEDGKVLHAFAFAEVPASELSASEV